MLIDFQIFKWLVDIKVIPNTQKLQIRGDGQIEANEEIMNIIRNGTIFTEIIRSLRRKTQQSLGIRLQSPSNLRQLKNANTSAVRLYNWNIIIETLSHLHYEIENDTKTLIVAGDEDVAMQILKDIYSRILMLDKGIFCSYLIYILLLVFISLLSSQATKAVVDQAQVSQA